MNPQLADRDAQIAEILEQLLAQVEAGASPDLEAIIRKHPEFADELRELWATIQIAEHLAKSSLSLDTPTLVPGASSLAGDCARLEFSDYELLEELGRGGMGIVYKARQKSLDRIVALKMILRGDLASPADVARFRSEAEAAAQLNHPHIVPVYEVGEHEGRPYFSMQLISGTTLARCLADGPLPSRLAAEMLVPVCRAVAMAHRHGVLHRDLKPSNILIDDDGRTYVTDFGLAKRVSPSEIDSAACPTERAGRRTCGRRRGSRWRWRRGRRPT